MKITLATIQAPFSSGLDAVRAEDVAEACRADGHLTDIIHLPFSGQGMDILGEFLAWELLDLSGYGDRLIALGTPAHFLCHPHKIVWFSATLPGLYAQEGAGLPRPADISAENELKTLVQGADRRQMTAAKSVWCTSPEAARTLKLHYGREGEVLVPPGTPPGRALEPGQTLPETPLLSWKRVVENLVK